MLPLTANAAFPAMKNSCKRIVFIVLKVAATTEIGACFDVFMNIKERQMLELWTEPKI